MKILYSGYAVLLSIVLLLALRVADPTALQSVRGQTFDAYQQLDEIKQSQDVVIINIGEKSLAVNGQYPWPRQYYAQMVIDVAGAGGGVLGWTIMFPEADRFSGDETFANYLMENKVNVQGARRNPINFNVLSQATSTRGIKTSGPHIGTGTIGPVPAKDYLLKWPNLVTNIPLLEAVANGKGVTASAPQPDNQTRTYPLAITVGDRLYPSFAVEMLRVSKGQKSYMVKTSEIGIQEVAVKGYDPIVTQPDGTAYIRFNNTFEEIEYVGAETLDHLAGKMVIIGVTAEGIANPVPTPRGNLYPQQIQAHMLQNFIDGSNITRSQLSAVTELLCALLTMLLVMTAVYRIPIWASAPVSMGILGGIAYFSVYQYTANLVLFDATFPVFAGFIVFTQTSFNNFYVQFKLRAEIQKQFAGYASPTVVRMLQENPGLIKDGMKKEVSICFSDLRGFTPLGESFGDDVKGLTEIMNGYMDAITQPILDADGMVIKYIGDASMHIHNAPMDDPDHPKSAVQTGIQMIRAVDKFNARIVAEGRPPIGMGAGINTGLGYIGEMGSSARHSYDILGDAVSTAARIESKCKEYGCLLLVGGDTYKHTKSDFFYLKVDDLQVKGKSVGIEIYTVLDIKRTKYVKGKQLHAQMHKHYRNQDFNKAIKLCNQLSKTFDGKMKDYYAMWIERCEFQLTQDLPKDWNGIFIATGK